VTTPLLSTKLYIPPNRPDLVSRPQLIEQLNKGLTHQLTLVSAPAGFGKSTLLSAWVQQVEADSQVTWLSLDEGDNDLTRFLTYIIAALQTIESNIGQGALAALQSPGVVNIEVVLTIILNEIAELPKNVILVLDDYHVIESQIIDQALTFLLEHLPTQLHLVIASRIDPTLPLSRLRARRQIAEVRANDLRFSLDEVTNFFNRVIGFDLSAQDVEALDARTEGWVAGLQLTALSIPRSGDVREFVRSFTDSNRYILDYLGEEVFSRQPQNIQDFLLRTSLLDRLTGPLCDALSGRNDGDATLESLDRENLFIIPLDNERCWYRYHHLFADFLQRRLRQTQPKLVSMLHCQASDWYTGHDFQFEAIHHALAGDDFEKVADLIEENGLNLIGQGAFTSVQKYIDTLPRNTVRERPYLCVYHAWASNFSHHLDAIEPYLEDAQRALLTLNQPTDDNITRDIHGHIATLRAWNARRQRDNALAINLLKDAVDYLGDGNPFVRTFTELNLGLAYLDDRELVEAADSLRNAVSLGYETKNELASLLAISHLAAILILQGRLHEAAKLCRNTIRDQLARHEKPHPTMAMIYLRLGWVLAEWNDVDGFFANLSQGVILANQIGYDAVVKAGSQAMAWYQPLLAEQGKIIEFSKDVAKIIDRVMSLDNDDDNSTIENQNVETYLSDDSYFEIFPGYSHHAQANKLAEEDRLEEALALLGRIYESAQKVEGIGLMIEARSAEALICQSQGDIDRALDALEDALSLGEPEGYVRTFVDRDEPMAKLLAETAERGFMPDYTSKLLTAFDTNNQGNIPLPRQPLVEPLSKREVEVLQLIAQGLSNREISERLFLALSTVKGHNRNIFAKLQVQRRTEAVARARELGLV